MNMNAGYNYREVLEASERVNWRVSDIIGGDRHLDFGKRFLPESLARVEALDFLSETERRTFNQIRGHEYLVMFGLVEEFIAPFVLDHARAQMHGPSDRVRALLGFVDEEAKHIELFRAFRSEFERGFGTHCDVIGPPEAIAQAILAHDPLAVALTILHIEWFVQRHYVDSVKDDHALCPQFKSLLKHHWMEEVQHAKLDTLMVAALAEGRSQAAIDGAFEEYLQIGGFIDGGLAQQLDMNLDAFERATGRRLTADERSRAVEVQRGALRWTYLGSGMTHPKVIHTVGQLSAAAQERLENIGPVFS
jgi:hypothetical protein